jgi:hypothetical protein
MIIQLAPIDVFPAVSRLLTLKLGGFRVCTAVHE